MTNQIEEVVNRLDPNTLQCGYCKRWKDKEEIVMAIDPVCKDYMGCTTARSILVHKKKKSLHNEKTS